MFKNQPTPKIESPMLGHNQINHEMEQFIAKGLREEEIDVPLFPSSMKLQDRLKALFDMKITLLNEYKARGYEQDLVIRQPLLMGINQLIQEYIRLDHELTLVS